jgi:hypothetical protein
MHADGFGGTIDCPDCAGAGVQLHHLDMRFDGLLLDDSDRLHILERKTYKNRPKLASLQTNDQFLAYMWGAEQLGVGEIAGIAYDGLWRRDAVPKRNATFEDLFLRVTLRRLQSYQPRREGSGRSPPQVVLRAARRRYRGRGRASRRGCSVKSGSDPATTG